MKEEQRSSTRRLLLSIWDHLSLRRRIQLALLIVVMLVSGGTELLSLGALLPFLAVISNPERLWQQPLMQALAIRAGFTTATQLLLPATLAFSGAAVIAAMVRLANLWLNGRLAAAVGSDLSCEVYRRTLFQPYSVHVQRNSAEVIASATNQINRTVVALTSLLQMVTAVVVAAALLAGLLLINWRIAIGTATLFGCIYGLLALTANRRLHRNSQLIAIAYTQQLKALQEGLGAIRDVLLEGNQNTYLEIYRKADWPQRQLQAENQFSGTYPRYAVEGLGLVVIALLGYILVSQRGSGGAVIPLLGALALGAQRILPALQQIYVAWSNLKALNADLKSVVSMLAQSVPTIFEIAEPMSLNNSIKLDGIFFRYGSDHSDVLKGLDITIHRGEHVGLVGRTGSGKSTTIDVLMGLLKPTSGRLLVDGKDIYDPAHPERLAAWRAAIAHVPQNIYLSDSSIAENIAFGTPYNKIDFARVEQAAKQAQIASFIESRPKGYKTIVGERGISLSGGQRQRIGIARALYKKAPVLILDEATSALDIFTEKEVMVALEELSEGLTVVIVAHRLSTVQDCDRVIQLENGVTMRA